MKSSILGIISLLRLKEYVYYVLIASILGVSSSPGEVGWRFAILLLANVLAVGFGFMVDDIEDAPDDALSIEPSDQNPISAGIITPKTARIATLIVGFLCTASYAFLGTWPLIFGGVALILGYFTSHRGFKLKSLVLFDILLKSLMLAWLPFLSAYFTYAKRLTQNGFWSFLFVMTLSLSIAFYSKFRRAPIGQAPTKERNLPITGDRSTHMLIIIIVIIAVFSGVMTLFVIEIIPLWVFGIMAILTIIFAVPPWLNARKGTSNLSFRNLFLLPLTRAAAFALMFQYLIPWFNLLWKG